MALLLAILCQANYRDPQFDTKSHQDAECNPSFYDSSREALLTSECRQLGLRGSQPYSRNAIKPPIDAGHRRGRPRLPTVLWRTFFVPGTQTYCGNRARMEDGRQNSLNGGAFFERFLTRPGSALRAPGRCDRCAHESTKKDIDLCARSSCASWAVRVSKRVSVSVTKRVHYGPARARETMQPSRHNHSLRIPARRRRWRSRLS